jgi:hypothetical protein
VKNSYWQAVAAKHTCRRTRRSTVELDALAQRTDVIKVPSVRRAVVDTTVMERAVAHPPDSRLLKRWEATARHGLKLRQNYSPEAATSETAR